MSAANPAIPDKTVGDACLAAYQRLQDEIIRFQASELYILRIENAALQDKASLKDARDDLMKWLTPDYDSPQRYFREKAFNFLVASFELFLRDVLAIIIMVNPKKVGQCQFALSEILDSLGIDELVRRSIEDILNKMMYKKPLEYLRDVADLLSIDATPLKAHWPSFVEAKARRDLGVHNGWRCNSIYIRKLAEVGIVSAFEEGDSVSPSYEYGRGIMDSLRELGSQLMDGVIKKKHPASLNKSHK